MEIEEKIELNKKIRNYEGQNNFLLSLKKQLKSSTYLQKIEIGKRKIKILTDNQYNAASEILDSNF